MLESIGFIFTQTLFFIGLLVGIVLIRKRIALDWGLFILGGLLAMLALIGVLTTSTPPPS